MKHASRTLIALAAAAPMALALDVKDDDVKLGLKLQLQVRAEWSDAVSSNETTETPWNATNGAVGINDPAEFYIRRARIGFAGSYKGDYKFAVILRNDGQDYAQNSSSSSIDPTQTTPQAVNFNRRPEAHVAFIERVFKQEDMKLEHSIRAGLDYAFFNGSSAVFSSSGYLFPSARATDQGAMLAPRGVGVGYKLDGEFFTWGVDAQNNTGDGTNGGDGLVYTTRLHLTPPGDMAIKKPTESFLGKEGTHAMVSVEYGQNNNDRAGANSVDLTAYGAELLVHWEGLTALAEIRQASEETTNVTTEASSEIKRQIWVVQAGYAFPMGDTVLEPAVRFTSIDLNKDIDEEGSGDTANAIAGTRGYSGQDYGTSGDQFEIGVNWYLNGHSNKVQVAYMDWSAEVGPAEAQILRAQWQLSF